MGVEGVDLVLLVLTTTELQTFVEATILRSLSASSA
jgi:hypothetical protein